LYELEYMLPAILGVLCYPLENRHILLWIFIKFFT